MNKLHTPQPKVIAFEGGPCGGKTTAVKALSAAMLEIGRPFTELPEVATEHINTLLGRGIRLEDLAAHDRPAFIDFETGVLADIVSSIARARNEHGGTPTIIAADRIDIAAYVTRHEYQTILARLGRVGAPLKTDVDTVLYLPTLAHTNPRQYEALVSTNTARYERNASQAIQTCDANFETVRYHADVRVYRQHDLSEKIGAIIVDVMAIQDEITTDGALQ